MKISYNWLKSYIQTDLSAEAISDILTSIGLEVEGIEKSESIPGGLKGVVVGEVLECAKHPDADRLSITKVNLGAGEPVQIVCGAPNVAAGQKVLVATIGTMLYPKGGEPFQIKKGKIRGQESLGMICAEDELGLGSSHAGIMVLDPAATVGTPAAEFLQIREDYCIEIGLTPNRTDAFSHYGVARDLAAALRNMEGIQNESAPLRLPDVTAQIPSSGGQALTVEVRNAEACPRYCGITLENIKVAPSPDWLQDYLTTIGLRPINNIVDITNFVQHEIGQPLHAFDADRMAGGKVVVRLAHEGETMTTLEGTERKLDAQDLLICDEKEGQCIAGVFGGLTSGVTESTTRIFLESAYFNPVFVRKTSKRHALKTDASFRFERGADPNAAPWALRRAVQLIAEMAGGVACGDMIDVYPSPIEPANVRYNWTSAAQLIGKEIPIEKTKSILKDLDMEILAEDAQGVDLRIPLYRSDVQREADVVEDVLRIYGFNNIEIPKRMSSSTSSAPAIDAEKLQYKVSDMLSSIGFHEIMGMSLTRAAYSDKPATAVVENHVVVPILNPLSGDLGIMRPTMLYSGMEAIALNQNHKNPDIRFYEFGKVFFKTEKGYHEERRLSLLISGRRQPESWNNPQDAVSFTDLKAAFERILRLLGVPQFTFESVQTSIYATALEYKAGKQTIATLGQIAPATLKAFDVRNDVWFADVQWDALLKSLSGKRVSYREPEKYPAVRRDLSLLLSSATTFSEIEKLAYDTERKLLRDVNLFDVYEGKNLEAGKKSYAVSFILQDSSKTMTDQQVETAMTKIQKALEEKLGATLRG